MLAFISLGFIVILKKYAFSDPTNEKDAMERERLLTSIRKIFHVLICIAYSLGFAHDRHLLYLCSYGMLILLILIEVLLLTVIIKWYRFEFNFFYFLKTIRYHKIGKIGVMISDTMNLFVDEKDSDSKLILSHIYLLVGFSFPLWVSNINGNISSLNLFTLIW